MFCHIHKFREKLAAGRFCLGAGITLTDPTVTEALAESVDFFWIDLEHNPTSLQAMTAHLIAARAGGAPAIVRVPSGEVGWIKRVLDSGAEGIILPQAANAGDVRAFVSACRYPPKGTRGFGPRRPSNYGRHGGVEYMQHAIKNLFVVAQIETVTALQQIDEITAIDGLDALVVGPNDLSGSMGIPGQVHHADVLAAITTVVEKAHAAGMTVGIGMGADRDHVVEAARLGVNWAQCGNDFEYLIHAADRLFARVRRELET